MDNSNYFSIKHKNNDDLSMVSVLLEIMILSNYHLICKKKPRHFN